jgi:hypothetical protein
MSPGFIPPGTLIRAALRSSIPFGRTFAHPIWYEAMGLSLSFFSRAAFKKRSGNRASRFEQFDKPALQPLPATPYDLSEWSKARINIDYHCAFDENFYSVPYTLVQEQVEIRATPTTVEIFHQGQRVASHPRSPGKELAITNPQHRPKSHQAHMEWTPSRMVNCG